MSKFARVQQWSAFARNWYIYDAKWQNPFHSAKKITRVLEGRHKVGNSCDVCIHLEGFVPFHPGLFCSSFPKSLWIQQ